jgi:hypothetical protein
MSDGAPAELGQDETQSPYTNTESEAGKSPFACNICKRNYSRVDHLARHYRSRELHIVVVPVVVLQY